MKRLLLATVLSTFCLAGCETVRTAVPVRPPAERMDCQAVEAEDRPAIPAEYVIDWSRVTTIPQARTEHEAYVRSVRTREGIVAGYIVELEGGLWVCASDDQWLRDFFDGLPEG